MPKTNVEKWVISEQFRTPLHGQPLHPPNKRYLLSLHRNFFKIGESIELNTYGLSRGN